MDYCCTYTYAGLTINPDVTTAGLFLDMDEGETGLDGAPIRSQVDPRGQADGGIVHIKHFGPRVVTFKGFVSIPDIENRETPEYREALVDIEVATILLLEAELNTENPLVWTPAGQTQHELDCSYGTEGGEIQFTGSMIDRSWTFQLIAADPIISIAT